MAASKHYAAVASHYGSAFFYAEGPFRQWQIGCIMRAMNEGQNCCNMADVGGGDGSFASSLARSMGLAKGSVTLVEPSKSMIASDISNSEMIGERVCTDGLSWATNNPESASFDRILLKEVVHHMGTSFSRRETFKAMQRRLTATGKLVIATRPRVPAYPFFPAALDNWMKNQPDSEDILEDLRAVGYLASSRTESYPCSLDRKVWQSMVKDRIWSTFSGFSDQELEAGCQQIPEGDPLEFDEIMVLITAEIS